MIKILILTYIKSHYPRITLIRIIINILNFKIIIESYLNQDYLLGIFKLRINIESYFNQNYQLRFFQQKLLIKKYLN